MIISDLDHLNAETRPISGGVFAFGFANGSAEAVGNKLSVATTVSLTSTYTVVFAAPRVYH
ncbi:hypothetical protein [Leptolyngbya sp. NIES-2104]|uniref:hypothetical protein n=1 Tax=Leptolyngbya sp. NIES-2104 TaxID=1552121 RepID=UPI0006ECBD90|nr:hypothetical protein [Leptolyngbya sp. NIES-2104]GAP99359.1 hypothetical protein NIES2104_59200 [Leptolyngbya sp. NIES-2104]